MYSRPRLSPKIAPCPSTITIGSCSGAHHSGMLVNGCQTNCLSVVTKSSVFQSVICSKTRQVTRNVTLKYVSRGQHSGERTRLACPFRRLTEMPLLFNQKRSLARRQRQHARRVRSPAFPRTNQSDNGGHISQQRRSSITAFPNHFAQR